MDMASLLKNTANLLVGVSLVKWIAADFRAEIRHDTAGLREKADGMVRRSPYRAAGFAAAAGALVGLAISRHRAHRTIPTRF
jgi:hypothetical protein